MIANNYFYKPSSNTDHIGGAINLMSGTSNRLNHNFQQCDNITIANNIIFDAVEQKSFTNHAIVFGSKYGSIDINKKSPAFNMIRDQLPKNIKINNNIIYNTGNTPQFKLLGNLNFSNQNITFKKNKVYKYSGILTSGIDTSYFKLTNIKKSNGYRNIIKTYLGKGPNTHPLTINDEGPNAKHTH